MENIHPNEDIRYQSSCSKLPDWLSLRSSNQEEYCNSNNLQLLLQQRNNDVFSFSFHLLGHLFARSLIIGTTCLNKRLLARRNKLARQEARRKELKRLEEARRHEFERLQEKWLREFQWELQKIESHSFILKNTGKLPSSALFVHASADANYVNKVYQQLGQELMENIHLRHLILDKMISISTPNTARTLAILAKGISQSKVESLTIKDTVYMIFSRLRNPNDQTNQANNRYMGQFLSDILITDTPSSLTKLALVYEDLTDADVMTLLAQGLSSNRSLTSLVIDSCIVRDSCLRVLFSPHGLWSNASLLHLQLKRCHIWDKVVTILVEHWPPESPIQTLSLPFNGISPHEVQLLVLDAAHSHPALQTLDLSHNWSSIDNDTLRMIGDDLPNQPYLTSLDLSGCAWKDFVFRRRGGRGRPNIENLAAINLDQAGPALVQGIRRNLHIQHVNVRGMGLSRGVEEKVDFYASCNRMGRYLLSNDFELPASCWSYILAKCERHPYFGPSFLLFFLREHPNLVPTKDSP